MRDKLGETLKKKLWEEYGEKTPRRPGKVPRPPGPGRAPRQTADGPQEALPGSSSNLMQWLGGLVSVSLVIGALYWVYELGRRDAAAVPVVRALEGAARVQPENPGGPEVDNQGLQVNEVLANDTTAPVEPETTLAPPPQRIVEEDILPPDPEPEVPRPEPVLVPLDLALAPPEDTSPGPEDANTASTLPPSLPGADPNMTRPARRMPEAGLNESADLLSVAIASAIQEVTGDEGQAEPGETPAPVGNGEEPQGMTPPTDTVPLPQIAAGEAMIQLGAYDDEESANRDYDALVRANSDIMGRLVRFVERREAGGRVFYRLRARGFTSKQEADAMCEALLGRAVQCISVVAR